MYTKQICLSIRITDLMELLLKDRVTEFNKKLKLNSVYWKVRQENYFLNIHVLPEKAVYHNNKLQ